MPGIVGFTRITSDNDEDLKVLSGMRDSIRHKDFYVNDQLFIDGNVCGTRSHINVINTRIQPVESREAYVWLDGAFYNEEQLKLLHRVPGEDSLEILLNLYHKDPDLGFLKDIDGIYSSVIYDKAGGRVHLITDRYGLKHLFWAIVNCRLAWGSEIKAFLCLPHFDSGINRTSVQTFLKYGHLLGDSTWFPDVELVPPGSVISCHIENKAAEVKQYWDWDQIIPVEKQLNEEETALEMASLFKDAVGKRCVRGKRTGLFLSGGLDSRAILAALPQEFGPFHSFTTGQQGCDDIKTASVVSKLKGAQHHVVAIEKENLIPSRFDAVWWTEGQTSIIHMHLVGLLPLLRENIDICFDGYLAGATVGGKFLDWYGESGYINTIKNKGRRADVQGMRYPGVYVDVRVPFFDNQFMEYVMALPKGFLRKSRIYHKMLLTTFPGFFKDIPWEAYRVAIGKPSLQKSMIKFLTRAKRKLSSLHFINKFYKPDFKYTDYPNWYREPSSKAVIKELLLSNNTLLYEYVDSNEVKKAVGRHFSGWNYADLISKHLTLEIWLNQLYKDKFKPSKK